MKNKKIEKIFSDRKNNPNKKTFYWTINKNLKITS
jgi:hypothetical protein